MPVTRTYDLIAFGDEVPGILALVCAAREYRRRSGVYPRSLLILKGNSLEGIGGHLVRGKLAYLDRSVVPPDIRRMYNLDTFGDPAAIYKEFLARSGVVNIALDPVKADAALRQMLNEVQASTLGRVEIGSVLKDGAMITGIELTKGETYLGKQFIDSTVNAELAQAAGVRKYSGFGMLGLPEAELPATLVFETPGLTVQRLQQVEEAFLRRFTNPADTQAQSWLNMAAGNDPVRIKQLQKDLFDSPGQLKRMYAGSDYIDIRSKALSIAYHAFRGTALSSVSSAVLDNGNVAVLPGGRMLWNALLFKSDAAQAEALARGGAKPTEAMLKEIGFLETWFKSLGATGVKPASELYIRHAGNVMDAVEPLSGSEMLAGGVSPREALGTFGYAFDIRGGIAGLDQRAGSKGVDNFLYKPPLFNIGIRHAQMKSVPNLAVLGPASGFDGYACGAGRIVEFNVGVGQGIGIACAIALHSNRPLAQVSNLEVRQVLEQTRQLSKVFGQGDRLEAQRLEAFEQSLIA